MTNIIYINIIFVFDIGEMNRIPCHKQNNESNLKNLWKFHQHLFVWILYFIS